MVKAYASEHIWYPAENAPAGDDPGYVCYLNSYRCVFTYTRSPENGLIYRQLSVSVPSKLYPTDVAVGVIAEMFGFSGAEQGIKARVADGSWLHHIETKEPHCVVLAEELDQLYVVEVGSA